ncbi:winged helix-turn-helix domain-containing protein [Subtercola sp. PAMC28395]|uniref:helix-turn-helix domain-containing protein n=1 Tax=Subtercola sp. PAMC28395 TaxID=2846775 RepID=UPI001C0C5718|nr:winged helix-turn-helix domain-containing protein [Subtercola sp. PAMC28395]QWT24445.1 winged helix-turn-helix domain-containing protein [Subtercola sp. PAMC28395]
MRRAAADLDVLDRAEALSGLAGVQRAQAVFGISSVRLDIITALLSGCELSDAALMERFGITRNGIRRHLKALESEGIIVGRHTTHPRGAGPITYWRADADELLMLLDDLRSTILNS